MPKDELKPLIDKLITISERNILSAGLVAELAGVTQPAVSAWRNKTKKPDIENVQCIANKLGLNLSQLLVISEQDLVKLAIEYRKNKDHENVFMVAEPKVTYRANKPEVPLVSDVQAGRIEEAILEVDDFKMIRTKKNHSDLAYALQVVGTSMTSDEKPSFPEGTIILADPNMIDNIYDKDFVIGKLDNEDAVTFKQFRIDSGKPYLNPLNKEFPKIWSGFKVIAKVFDIYTEDWF